MLANFAFCEQKIYYKEICTNKTTLYSLSFKAFIVRDFKGFHWENKSTTTNSK